MAFDRRAYQRQWERDNRQKILDQRLRRQFGDTPPRPAVCEVCGDPPSAKKALCLDHEHLTGTFRGWLCHRCNTAIGLLRDSSDLCVALARYLRAHQ